MVKNMHDTKKKIEEKYWMLFQQEKIARELAQSKFTEEWNSIYSELYEECEKNGGHDFQASPNFSDTMIGGHCAFACVHCRKRIYL